MNMMRTLCGILAAAMLAMLSGCNAPKVSWRQAQEMYDGHRTEKMNAMYYAGSDKNDHYLHHAFLTMYDTGLFRVDKSELTITNDFPVTTDKTKWRKLDMPLRIDLAGATIITNKSEQSAAPLPPAPRPGPSEGAR
jgi:hypothetical protein